MSVEFFYSPCKCSGAIEAGAKATITNTLATVNGKRVLDNRLIVTTCTYCDRVLKMVIIL